MSPFGDCGYGLGRQDRDQSVVARGQARDSRTRLAVEFIVELLANRWSEQQIIENYPGVTHEDISACLRYAADVLKSERVYLAADKVMILPANENFPLLAVEALRAIGHNVLWTRTDMPGKSDDAILRQAQRRRSTCDHL